jgi:hypothetical protein
MTLRYSTGLRNMVNGLEATVRGAVIGAGLAFVDGGSGDDTITDSGNGFITEGFAPGDKLFVRGATTPGNDAALTGVRVTAVAEGVLTVPTGSVATDEAGAAGTVVAFARGGSKKDIFKDGILYLYSGTQPTTADAAVAGVLLARITVSSGVWVAGAFGNGLEFENDPTGGIIGKNSETWSGLGLAAGTAGWFRLCANAADTGLTSLLLPRIDGSVGSLGADLVMAATGIVVDRPYTIDTFQITYPAYYGA